MTRLVLINGAPGAGKSTLALRLAQDAPLTLALDVDAIKFALGRWEDDLLASGQQSRRLSLALARQQLSEGHDVVMGQYLARTEFIEALESLAVEQDAEFLEVILDLDTATLADRLATRSVAPDRPEHENNSMLVTPGEAGMLVASLEPLRRARPDARWIDASGSLATTLGLLRVALTQPNL